MDDGGVRRIIIRLLVRFNVPVKKIMYSDTICMYIYYFVYTEREKKTFCVLFFCLFVSNVSLFSFPFFVLTGITRLSLHFLRKRLLPCRCSHVLALLTKPLTTS